MRVVMRGIEEFFELGVRHGVAVNVKRTDGHSMVVVAARRIFPRFLHVNPNVVAALNFNSMHVKHEAATRNANHPRRSAGCGLCAGNFHDVLRQKLPLVRKRAEGLCRKLMQGGKKRAELRIRLAGCGEHRTKTVGLDLKA